VKGLELSGVRSTMAGEAPTRPDPEGFHSDLQG